MKFAILANCLNHSFRRFPETKNGANLVLKSQAASYHVPVMLEECCNYLNITEGNLYVDCTLGGGGHTKAILERGGLVLGIDQDLDAISHTSSILSSYIQQNKLEIVKSNFRSIQDVVSQSYLARNQSVSGILMDLGISSYQIDEPTRGFSFGAQGPLDMRMNRPQMGLESLKASDLVNSMSVTDLANVLYEFGEERKSRQIAREIVLSRPISTTQDLVNTISKVTSFQDRQKVLARCFQALRIYVNDEIGALKDALIHIPKVLKPRGRLVVMSYHSLEDRLVKNIFKTGSLEGNNEVSNNWRLLTKKAVTASDNEIERNKRSRSAKLRAAEIIDEDNQEVKLSKTIAKYGSRMGQKQLRKLATNN